MNHSNRHSQFITPQQAKNIVDAAAHAWMIGHPFNKAVTIHLKMLDVANAQSFITALFEKHGWYLRGTGTKPCWVATLEDGGKGLHMHAAVHVPDIKLPRYHWELRKWASQLTGNKIPKNAIMVKQIEFSNCPLSYLYLGVGNQTQRSGLKGWVWYLLKGTDPQAAVEMNIRHAPQGGIWNKRCQLANCLQPNAIRKWKEKHPCTMPYRGRSGMWVTTGEAVKQRMLSHAGLTEASGYEPT